MVSKKNKKVPSAQDQVHGKVNSGIMTSITGGGLFEEVEEELIPYGKTVPHKELDDFKPNIQPLIMYKQFKLRLDKNGRNLAPGYVFPLYVNTDNTAVNGKSGGLKVGKWYKSGKGECWLDTNNNRLYTTGKGYNTDGNTISKLAYRPGWHLTTTPWGNQRGATKAKGGPAGTGNNYVNTRDSEVWAKVEICVDIDATERARARSQTPVDQCLDDLGDREYYKYKTNSNATDDQAWYIVDTIRIIEILDDDSVDSINNDYYQNLLSKNPSKKLNTDPYSYTKNMTNDIPYWKMPRVNGKRYSKEDLKNMGYEPAEPTRINESTDKGFDFEKSLRSIAEFMKDEGLNVKPFPKVKLDWGEQDGLFIQTGYYVPDDKLVVLFCKDRHPKDILRSFAHEMIHHSQNLDGKNLSFTAEDNVKDNNKLEEVESEAYLKGNIIFRKWTEAERGKNGKGTLNESAIVDDINPEDVDLSSFKLKNNLNPKFWKDGKLDSRVRMKLLDIADDFIDFLDVDWVEPDDIILTGSLVNFNWNRKYSDVDLHIVYDFSKVDERVDFVKEYFNSKKSLWNKTHQINIFGFPVEVYVQDINEIHKSTGVYSLNLAKWIIAPNKVNFSNPDINIEKIKERVADYVNRIDKLVDEFKDAESEYDYRQISEKAKEIFDEIKKERSDSMKTSKNEFSDGNIIFKSLRRLKYIEKLVKLRDKSYDELKSLS